MLKRYQVLIPEWLAGFIQVVAEKDDISFSEAVRLFLCEGIVRSAPVAHPEFRAKMSSAIIKKVTKEGSNPQASLEKRHQMLSKLYFETRKITELLQPKIKKFK